MPKRDESALDRMDSSGVYSTPFVDLLAIGFSRREADVGAAEESARQMLRKYGTIRAFGEAAPADLAAWSGFERFEMARAQALMEIGRRLGTAGKGEERPIEDAEDVVKLFDNHKSERKEHFYAVLLDSKGFLLRTAEIHVGTLTMSLVGPREVFREAIREGASSVIVVHNHPSGDPTPSPEDIEVTRTLVQIGKLLDLPVQDHVILGEPPAFTSLRRRGLM